MRELKDTETGRLLRRSLPWSLLGSPVSALLLSTTQREPPRCACMIARWRGQFGPGSGLTRMHIAGSLFALFCSNLLQKLASCSSRMSTAGFTMTPVMACWPHQISGRSSICATQRTAEQE